MARINLLPWREEARERKNKEFITQVVLIFLLSAAVALAVWYYFDNQLTEQQRANDLVSQENQRLDGVLTEIETLEQRREDIISRMKVIQDLQGTRPIPVRVWDDLARAMPEALYLTSLKREGNLITLNGRADNPNVVSNLIRNLDNSDWMTASAVRSITKDIPNNSAEIITPEQQYVTFEVTTTVVIQAAKPDEEQVTEDSPAEVTP
ncbi:PilN domain-containing protein [Moraxella lincolnii]|uniref:Pilus assembly protein PilS n=1 Tax=Lwoffella lincolnii TaxID=90241 RepID=A0A1T0CC64_9GAMM|nr:PilN domain-containing protein [Moraxella lincolnii]OOS19879.1 pilus assembly protein PilS [Moraxella lincolnii]